MHIITYSCKFTIVRRWSNAELIGIESNKIGMSGIDIDSWHVSVIVGLSKQSVVKFHELTDAYIYSIVNLSWFDQVLNYLARNPEIIIKIIATFVLIGMLVGGGVHLWKKIMQQEASKVLITETSGIAYNVADIAKLQLDLTKKVSQINTHVIEVEKVSQATRDNLWQIHTSTVAEIDQIYNYRRLQANEALYKDVARLTEINDTNTLYIMTTANRLRSLITEVASIAR